MNKNIRFDGIDALRGIAVSGVVLYHFFVLLGFGINPMFPYIHTFGSLGVPLFFIISGYLIYRSVENNINSKGYTKGVVNYLLHRFFRIAPAYYINLLAVIIFAFFMFDISFFSSS